MTLESSEGVGFVLADDEEDLGVVCEADARSAAVEVRGDGVDRAGGFDGRGGVGGFDTGE